MCRVKKKQENHQRCKLKTLEDGKTKGGNVCLQKRF